MKFTFHKNPDVGASPNTIAVFRDGEPLTAEELDAVLFFVNKIEPFVTAIDKALEELKYDSPGTVKPKDEK